MRKITRKVGVSVLIVSLSFLILFLLGVNAGGILPLALYLTGLLLSSLVVGFVALKARLSPPELAETSIIVVPLVFLLTLALIRLVASVVKEPVSGPTDGDGLVILLLFLLLPAFLLGLLGSLFELTLWKRGGSSA